MARTVTRYERSGLDTGTGDRSAARMAGSGPSAGTIVTPVSEGRKTVTDLFKDMVDKQAENERVANAAQKAENAYRSGKPAPLNSAGSQTIADVNTEKILTNTANTLKVNNQGYAEREGINLANERAKKASGLGQYNNTTSGTRTPDSMQRDSEANWKAARAMDEANSRDWQMRQQAANTARAQVDGQNQAAQDAAYSSRYAASVAADAQRDSATKSMFAALAGGSGGYKYWGG